jgi:hypothetical protein
VRNQVNTLFNEAADFTTTKAGLRDLVQTKLLLDSGGLSPSPLTLLHSALDMMADLGATPGSAHYLANLLGGDIGKAITASDWYKSEETPSQQEDTTTTLTGETVTAGGLDFVRLGNGLYWAEERVTPELWDACCQAEPAYKKTDTNPAPQPPASIEGERAVSWTSAQAFCAWFTREKMGDSFPGFEARLPTAEEWIQGDSAAPPDHALWEWCQDSFAPLHLFAETHDEVSPEKTLKGGVWTKTDYDPEAPASLPPDAESPFVSFRLVLAPLKTGN